MADGPDDLSPPFCAHSPVDNKKKSESPCPGSAGPDLGGQNFFKLVYFVKSQLFFFRLLQQRRPVLFVAGVAVGCHVVCSWQISEIKKRSVVLSQMSWQEKKQRKITLVLLWN